MNRNLILVICFVIFLAGIIGLSLTDTYSHEVVHEDIAVYAGCTANINLVPFGQSYTTVYCPTNLSMNQVELEMYRADIELEMFQHKKNSIMNTIYTILLSFIFVYYFIVRKDE